MGLENIYPKLVDVFGAENIILVGGAAMKLSCDPERQLLDTDVAVFPSKLRGVERKKLDNLGLNGVYDSDKLITVIDKETETEREVSSQDCGNMNNVLGLPPYTEENPTILGLNLRDVINEGQWCNFKGEKMKIPNPVHNLIMKYNLWLFRGRGEVEEQKDAKDINKIVKYYFKDLNTLIHTNSVAIRRNCRASSYEKFIEDMKRIVS
jgi:hypothetical protein